jgi:peroxiredoxin
MLMPACQSNADSQKAPDFTLLNLENKTVSLSDFKDKVVMINFFATYCPPCRMEIPDFVKLQARYEKEGFSVIGITVDDNPTVLLPPFIQRLGINYPVLQATSRVLQDYRNVYALPRTFILDRKHHIIRDYTGMVSEEEIEPVIKKALGLK